MVIRYSISHLDDKAYVLKDKKKNPVSLCQLGSSTDSIGLHHGATVDIAFIFIHLGRFVNTTHFVATRSHLGLLMRNYLGLDISNYEVEYV